MMIAVGFGLGIFIGFLVASMITAERIGRLRNAVYWLSKPESKSRG